MQASCSLQANRAAVTKNKEPGGTSKKLTTAPPESRVTRSDSHQRRLRALDVAVLWKLRPDKTAGTGKNPIRHNRPHRDRGGGAIQRIADRLTTNWSQAPCSPDQKWGRARRPQIGTRNRTFRAEELMVTMSQRDDRHRNPATGGKRRSAFWMSTSITIWAKRAFMPYAGSHWTFPVESSWPSWAQVEAANPPS